MLFFCLLVVKKKKRNKKLCIIKQQQKFFLFFFPLVCVCRCVDYSLSLTVVSLKLTKEKHPLEICLRFFVCFYNTVFSLSLVLLYNPYNLYTVYIYFFFVKFYFLSLFHSFLSLFFFFLIYLLEFNFIFTTNYHQLSSTHTTITITIDQTFISFGFNY